MSIDRFIKSLFSNGQKKVEISEIEIMLPKEEYEKRLQILRKKCKDNPLKLDYSDGNLVCGIRYFEENDVPVLEFKIGNPQIIDSSSKNPEQLLGLRSLTQVIFYPGNDEGIYQIFQADIKKQSEMLLGLGEYEKKHQIAENMDALYMRSVKRCVGGAVLEITKNGIEPNRDEVREIGINDGAAFFRAILEIKPILDLTEQ